METRPNETTKIVEEAWLGQEMTVKQFKASVAAVAEVIDLDSFIVVLAEFEDGIHAIATWRR